MKKFLIPLGLVLLVFLLLLTYTVASSIERKYYTSGINSHIAYIEEHFGEYPVARDGDAEVIVSMENTYCFASAVNRSGMQFRLFAPDTEGRESVVLAFPDGAEYTVYDFGKNNDDKDVAYINYRYSGTNRWFMVSGYETFSRVRACASLEGFGSPNKLA